MLEITSTPEWNELLDLMRSQIDKRKENITHHARHSDILEVKRAVGEYDGFRQAMEFIRGLGIKE